MKKKCNILVLGLIVLLVTSGCVKKIHQEFTEKELNFLPYKLGDTVTYFSSIDSIQKKLAVVDYNYHQSEEGLLNQVITDILVVSLRSSNKDEYFRYIQSKRNNFFTLKISTAFGHTQWYYYDFDTMEYITYYDEIEIDENIFESVCQINSPEFKSNILFNSTHGFLQLIDSTGVEYFFKLQN